MVIDKSKIVYISLTNGAGGAEQILQMSARVTQSKLVFLRQTGSSPLAFSSDCDDITFLSKHSISLGFIHLLKELVKYRKGYIIISSHPYLNAFLGILKRIGFLKSKLASRESTPVFLRFSGFKRLSYKLVYQLGYPAMDLLICQTDEMKAQLIDNLSFLNRRKVIVLRNPIDIEQVYSKSNEELDDPLLKDRFVCSAGRLIPIKGFDILIRAFSSITHLHEGIKLVILGEGAERANLQTLINSLGLQNKVVLRGFVNNPYPYFKNAEVCVVSSIREGFPNVLLQMMTLNNKVISSLCADGIEAFGSISLVKVNDVNQLEEALHRELKDPQKTENNKNLKYVLDRTPSSFINQIIEAV
jgi:glycosyltransferase involved in cell wall biosynthesis